MVRVLVLGSSGFLGHALVRRILSEDDPLNPIAPHTVEKVIAFDKHKFTPVVSGDKWNDKRVEEVEGDVTVLEEVENAMRGVDIVFHAAALTEWRPWVDSHALFETNVRGTSNVILACKKMGVHSLVYTSSYDVVYDGSTDLKDIDEDVPLPKSWLDDYSRSKAIAEHMVLEANTQKQKEDDGLHTIAIRVPWMYGEGDQRVIGNLIRASKRDLLWFRVGNCGSTMCSYVGNVADLHVQAGKALLQHLEHTFGKAYFATDVRVPVNIFDCVEPIMEHVGHPVPKREFTMPASICLFIAWMMELLVIYVLHPTLGLVWKGLDDHLPFFWTRSTIRRLTRTFTVQSDRAHTDLGYDPPYDPQMAQERTIAWWKLHSK
eukprot:TRINITY_DN7074_c0_g1_i1.p1 TRINITY_DN7074_c0_g1~~TRINITY_DN7074_c0_g1_i1.p1  ORF type:complete len:375 (+),score=100.19 TRINITY_DN7074_c0_g1_i1:176-1300(+)